MNPQDTAPPTRLVPLPVEGAGEIGFEVAEAPGARLWFSLGVRKSGSTLLHRIVIALARGAGVNPVDIPGSFFRRGLTVRDWMRTDLRPVIRPGNVYVGFRSFPANLADFPPFRTAPKVFLFRDPRDALVSQYFSDAYSHSLPARDTETGRKGAEAFERKRAETRAITIDEFVTRQAPSMEATLLAYAGMLRDPTCLCLRYEEEVFRKRALVGKILGHFGWSCPEAAVEALLARVDEVPEVEDPTRFVRRVVPGDHREKLKPETIAWLNARLAESLRVFGYA